MVSANLKELEAQTWDYVETLRNDPQARLESRKHFYLTHCPTSHKYKYGLGNSEIAFLNWEERGVLRPKGSENQGSAWWSQVNLWFIFLSEFGARALATGLFEELPSGPSKLWGQFILNPKPQTWYRAHNSSIIEGYLKFFELAEEERNSEKVFINKVLYRLLFAQFMVEGDFFLPRLGEFLANPQGISVSLITKLDGFYPRRYPMTKKEEKQIMGEAHNIQGKLVHFMDNTFIMPKLTKIYNLMATINHQPHLPHFLKNNQPSYPEGIPKSNPII